MPRRPVFRCQHAATILTILSLASPLQAQDQKSAPPSTLALAEQDPVRRAVLAVIDSAMDAISAGNLIAVTALMIPEGQMLPTFDTDSTPGYQAVTVARLQERGSMPPFVERGFDPVVAISGTVAMVWLPYDLWFEGKWSHCGVDAFLLIRVGTGWRIASMAYSIEQPPACRMHPAGTPTGYTGPP